VQAALKYYEGLFSSCDIEAILEGFTDRGPDRREGGAAPIREWGAENISWPRRHQQFGVDLLWINFVGKALALAFFDIVSPGKARPPAFERPPLRRWKSECHTDSIAPRNGPPSRNIAR
jgi:hypothetical protein